MDQLVEAESAWDKVTSISLEDDAKALLDYNKNLIQQTRGLQALESSFGKNELKVRERLAYFLENIQEHNATLIFKNKQLESRVQVRITDVITVLVDLHAGMKVGTKSINLKSSFHRLLGQLDQLTEDFQTTYLELKRRILESKRREDKSDTVPDQIVAGIANIGHLEIDRDEIRAMEPARALELVQSEISRLRGLTKGGDGENSERLRSILTAYTQLRKELTENRSTDQMFKNLRTSTAVLLDAQRDYGRVEVPIIITQHKFNRRAYAVLHDEDFDVDVVMGHYITLKNAILVGVREDIYAAHVEPTEAFLKALEKPHINPQGDLMKIGNPVKYGTHWYAPVFPSRIKGMIRIYEWGIATDKLR